MYNITLLPNLFETFFKKFFNTLADSVLQGRIFSRETIKKRGRGKHRAETLNYSV